MLLKNNTKLIIILHKKFIVTFANFFHFFQRLIQNGYLLKELRT